MTNFVTTRCFGQEKGYESSADLYNVPLKEVSRVGEEVFGKRVDVTILVLDDCNCGGKCTAGVRHFDYNGSAGLSFLSVFLA